jgi:hypothetical protein
VTRLRLCPTEETFGPARRRFIDLPRMPRLRTSLRSWILAGIAACHGNRAGKGGFKVHPRGHDPGAGRSAVVDGVA